MTLTNQELIDELSKHDPLLPAKVLADGPYGPLWLDVVAVDRYNKPDPFSKSCIPCVQITTSDIQEAFKQENKSQ